MVINTTTIHITGLNKQPTLSLHPCSAHLVAKIAPGFHYSPAG